MDRAERLQAHAVPESWMPNPEAHLHNPRDSYHFDWTCAQLKGAPWCSILDVGCWDGWLDFLLIKQGFKVQGVEAIPNLCKSAEAYAAQHSPSYKVHQGFFDEVEIGDRFDAVLCYEMLEHIPLDLVPAYVSKMEAIANRAILISLPDQKHEDNDQHLWTPRYGLILALWGRKKGFELTYKPHPGTPANFLIRWNV